MTTRPEDRMLAQDEEFTAQDKALWQAWRESVRAWATVRQRNKQRLGVAPTPASRQLTDHMARFDLPRLRDMAEEMFAPLASYRRREVYEYMNRLEERLRLQEAYIRHLEAEVGRLTP